MTLAEVQRVDHWPPGSLMLFDNTHFSKFRAHTHVGLGVVVTNDGVKTIGVVWDAGCKSRFEEYKVIDLNPLVISRVG